MYRQILVPLDGSRFAESALPVSLGLSRRTGARVHLVTVQEPIPSFSYDEWESAAAEWSGQYLANVVERIGDLAGGEVTTRLRSGHVVEALEDEAREHHADLVVMATHGRGLLSRAWLGSVAASFIHHTDRPVLLVRPDAEPPTDFAPDRTFSRILVPLDGSELSESALAHAVELGGLFGATYHLLRVVPYPMDLSSSYLPHTVQVNQQVVEDARLSAQKYLEEHAERLRAGGHTVSVSVVVVAQPGHGIVSEAENEGCDFIAMATHGRTGLTRALLGSTADKVLRAAHVPLLIYRPGPDRPGKAAT
ncbi:MAG: universal stress protein [Gemmatimonadetes bacterium]|nr:universal stress protein [Gemmatimonadota bacterium]